MAERSTQPAAEQPCDECRAWYRSPLNPSRVTVDTPWCPALLGHPRCGRFPSARPHSSESRDGEGRTMAEPDYRALYFELAHQVGLVQRIKAAAFDGQADGSQFWEAQGRLDALVGAALCWEDDPDLYATLLAKRRHAVFLIIHGVGADPQNKHHLAEEAGWTPTSPALCGRLHHKVAGHPPRPVPWTSGRLQGEPDPTRICERCCTKYQHRVRRPDERRDG
jgi:hypothetical protein